MKPGSIAVSLGDIVRIMNQIMMPSGIRKRVDSMLQAKGGIPEAQYLGWP